MIEFAEIKGFGLNALTLTFLATMFFTILQANAFIKQNQKIIKNKSGESVSFSFYSYFGFSALAVTVFGLYNKSLALSINGLLGILSLLIVVNLWRFKKIKGQEKFIAALSVAALPLMIFSSQKDLIFLLLGFIIGLTLISQIYEIWKNRSAGAYHPGQIFVSLSSCSFWLAYSIVAKIWAMQITNGLFLSLWLLLLFSFFKFKNKTI